MIQTPERPLKKMVRIILILKNSIRVLMQIWVVLFASRTPIPEILFFNSLLISATGMTVLGMVSMAMMVAIVMFDFA